MSESQEILQPSVNCRETLVFGDETISHPRFMDSSRAIRHNYWTWGRPFGVNLDPAAGSVRHARPVLGNGSVASNPCSGEHGAGDGAIGASAPGS